MTIEENIAYQRILSNGEHVVSLLAATGLKQGNKEAMVSISASIPGIDPNVTTNAMTAVMIEGGKGADLIVALSSVFTAAVQGVKSLFRVGDEAFVSVGELSDDGHLVIATQVSAVSIPLTMVAAVIESVQTLLNDVTGEYRRQIDELEKAAA